MNGDAVLDVPGIAAGEDDRHRNPQAPRAFEDNHIPFEQPLFRCRQAPVVQALKKAVKAVYKKDAKAMGIGGGTVAAVFRRAGFPAACWAKLDETAHQPNEYCIIDNMVGDAKVYGHILLQD